MGVYDRDYMQEKKPRAMPPAAASPYKSSTTPRAPLWARIKFRLWLWLKGRG